MEEEECHISSISVVRYGGSRLDAHFLQHFYPALRLPKVYQIARSNDNEPTYILLISLAARPMRNSPSVGSLLEVRANCIAES